MRIDIGHASASLHEEADADIGAIQPVRRCDSCAKTGWESEPSSPTEARSVPLNENAFLLELDAASKQQIQWDSVMCKTLGLDGGYAKISALLIMWEVNDWIEKTNEEICALEDVLKNAYGYTVKVLRLKTTCSCVIPCACSTQSRLDHGVSSFFRTYGNSENDLVILYHTGHGTYDTNTKHLELSGLENVEEKPAPESIVWNHTEREFAKVAKCDILTIMDTCFAGGVTALVQGSAGRTYEYLGASDAEHTTPAPGPTSVTSALVDTFKTLRERNGTNSFTTLDLQRELDAEQERRAKAANPPGLVKRGVLVTRSDVNKRRIELRAMQPGAGYFNGKRVQSYLTLRVELLQQNLSSDELNDLAKRLSKAVLKSKAKTRRLDYIGVQPRGKPSFRKAAKAVKAMNGFGGFRSSIEAAGVNARLEAESQRPGLYAVFGWVSPHLQPHWVMVLMYRPWPMIISGALLSILVARWLLISRSRHAQSGIVQFCRRMLTWR